MSGSHIKYLKILVLLGMFFCYNSIYSQNKMKNRQRNGVWIMYYDSAQTKIQLRGRYKNGMQKGKWVHYAPGGEIQKTEIYKRKKVKVKYFYPEGSIMKKGKAKLVLRDTLYHFYFTGEWKCFNKKGELSKIEFYEKGVLQNTVLYKTSELPLFNDSLARAIKLLYTDYYKWNDSVTYISRNYGKATYQYQRIKRIEAANDSSIKARMDAIIKKYSYPSKEMVGEEYTTLFFLISSYGIDVKDKYYDVIVEAAKKGILDKKDVAFFIDKVKVAHQLPQVYATQFVFKNDKQLFYPVEDINSVNARRAEVGLDALVIEGLSFLKY